MKESCNFEPDPMEIQHEIELILPRVVEFRQHIHAHPELSLKETETAAFVRAQLEKLELELAPPFLETDVVAMLKGDHAGRNVTLRADMDALPILESGSLPYRSKYEGVMHACGHDGHTAILLGAAMVLSKLKSRVHGSVRFIFQPGEEIVAAGKDLIKAGALHDPSPSMVLALHGWPGLALGKIASMPGPMMAAADFFSIKIMGRGSHGSRPEMAIDPILLANQVMNKLYQLPARRVSALHAPVVSICRISGGSNSNTIPDVVELEGTCRFFDKDAGEGLPALFHDILKAECRLSGATYDLDYRRPYLPLVNDAEIVSFCRQNVEVVFGEGVWEDIEEPVMVSEDFSYYIDKNPGAMVFLGMGEDSPGLHMPQFNFNDEALFNGIRFMVSSALGFLSTKHPKALSI